MRRILRWGIVLVLLVILISGSMAFYTVFFGGKDLIIPPLREMSVLDAVDEAERVGLEVKIEQVDSSIPSGTVLAQWPEPGTKVRRDKTILLKVSKGGERKAVPDFRGLEESKALAKIEELGFVPGDILRINDDQRAAGVVIAQNPASPAMIGGDRTISLLVSMGPEPKGGNIPVPDVAQRQETEAKELLSQSGLKVGRTEYVSTTASPEGMVMSTKPKVGTNVRLGSTVVLQVATNRGAQTQPETPAVQPPQTTTVASAPTTSTPPVTPPAPTDTQVGPAGPVQTLTKPEGQAAEPEGQTEGLISGLPDETAPTVQAPGTATPTAGQPTSQQGATGTAKVRYQVPPLTSPMSLKIEMVDATGTKSILSRDVKGGEYISLDAPFVTEGVVTVYLGGEFVWQERYK